MPDKIRVLHVADKFGVKGSSVHGVGRLFAWWMPRFDTERFDVGLVGLRGADPSVAALEEQGVHPKCLGKSKFDPSTVLALAREAKRFGAHILHLHGYGASNFGLLAAPLAGAKSVVHEHFVDPSVPGYQRVADRFLARRADAAVAVSRSVREFMIEQRHFKRDLVQVIYNGAPLEQFVPASDEAVARLRAELGIPPEHKVLVTIGRLDEQKGIRYLLEAVPKLRESAPPFTLIVVGDGPYAESLQEQASTLGIAENIIFAGFQQDIRPYQTLADIQVFPSLWEGTPLTVFEAMAMGKAIVSTDVDGLGEVLGDEETAILVPPRDSRALAAAIVRVLSDNALRAAVAKNASRKSAEFDIGATVERLQDVYLSFSWTDTLRKS